MSKVNKPQHNTEAKNNRGKTLHLTPHKSEIANALSSTEIKQFRFLNPALEYFANTPEGDSTTITKLTNNKEVISIKGLQQEYTLAVMDAFKNTKLAA